MKSLHKTLDFLTVLLNKLNRKLYKNELTKTGGTGGGGE